jgi:hypothetical protein
VSEANEVKRDNARAQKNSGRGPYQKGDAIWQGFLVDYKESAKSVSINKEMWAKICTDTFRVDRSLHPALKLIIGEGSSKVRLAVVEWYILEELVEDYERNRNS